MKKNFLFVQKSNNSTLYVILQDPAIKDGVVYGKKVGVFAGFDDENNDELIFRKCDPIDFMAGFGPWTMNEYTKELT